MVFLRNKRWIGRFYVDVFGQDRRTRKAIVLGLKSREFTKTEAKVKLKSLLAEQGINTPAHLERSLRPPVTFNHVADLWESKRLPQLKESSRYSAPLLVAKHLRPFFGAMPLETISTGVINEWKAGLEGKLAPKTIHNLWKMLRGIVNWHLKQNDKPKWARYPTLPDIAEDEQRWFTPEEVQRIVEAARGQYKVLFHLAAYTGLRFGELAGLHVEDVDFVRGLVSVRRSVWHGQEVSPKTRKGHRGVFLDSGTLQILRQHLGSRTSGRIFETRNSTPLENHNVVRRTLKPICDRLGIPRGGMHAFRHGRVSLMQASSVPVDFTQRQVGHSSLRTTSNYTKFEEDFARQTVERLASEMLLRTHSDKVDSVVPAAN
jgi:integrase